MANFHDFKKKEPNKTEKVLYELMMRQEMADRSLWTNSAFISALAMLGNVEPDKVADILVNGNDRIKEYSAKINEAIEKLEKAKAPEAKPEMPEKIIEQNSTDDTVAETATDEA